MKELEKLQNSTAKVQFMIQIADKLEHIHAARDKGLLQQPNLFDWREAAETNVKYRRVQQGIWDERWEHQAGKIWKHEVQDTHPTAGSSASKKYSESKEPGPKRKPGIQRNRATYR